MSTRSADRIAAIEDLDRETFQCYYNQLEEKWGLILANATVGLPQVEVSTPEGDVVSEGPMGPICALCAREISSERVPEGSPVGICENCEEQVAESLKGE